MNTDKGCCVVVNGDWKEDVAVTPDDEGEWNLRGERQNSRSEEG